MLEEWGVPELKSCIDDKWMDTRDRREAGGVSPA